MFGYRVLRRSKPSKDGSPDVPLDTLRVAEVLAMGIKVRRNDKKFIRSVLQIEEYGIKYDIRTFLYIFNRFAHSAWPRWKHST